MDPSELWVNQLSFLICEIGVLIIELPFRHVAREGLELVQHKAWHIESPINFTL